MTRDRPTSIKPAWLPPLRLNTLRGRYLGVVLLGSLLLALIAINVWWSLDSVTHGQLTTIQQRNDAQDLMSSSVKVMDTLETQMYRFISMPTQESREEIQTTLNTYHGTINNLLNSTWIHDNPQLFKEVILLEQSNELLVKKINRFIEIRSNQKLWFPMLTVMQEKMLAQSIQFNSAIEVMSQSIDSNLANPVDLEIYKTLMSIRNNWQSMLLEFRLYIANSIAVFTEDADKTVTSRVANIDLFHNQIVALLNKLHEFDRQGHLDLIAQNSLKEMETLLTTWQQHFHQVAADFHSDNWRRDIVFLREAVEPSMNLLHQQSSSLQTALNKASSQEISQLTHLAKHFSNFITYLVLGMIIIGILGYLIFHKSILSPVARIAQALKDEASGRQGIIIPTSSAEEIDDLTQAFASMREQIRSREAHLDHMAHHDALTQLPNRTLFHLRVEHALARTLRNNSHVGLLFIDLDRFKQINDTLGHDIGDQFLRIVAQKLVQCMRATDTISRLGGDEFAILIEDVSHDDQLMATANKILKALATPIVVNHHELHTTGSIGIAVGPRDATTVEALTKHADIAMYHAKSQGRNTARFYSTEMAAEVTQKMNLENQLHHAITQQEFRIYYQPIVDLRTGNILSMEALLRWQHPLRGLLTPGDFLSVLNETGLIKPLTQWMLRNVGDQYHVLKAAGYSNVRISVNLCGNIFRHDSILDIVVNAIKSTQMDPHGLILEITEDTLLENLFGAQQALRALREMGIQIALDDFGTGQSSLNHLRQNPIDIVKIDRDFIRDVPTDNSDSELVDAIIAMTHKLHLKVIAEGVENQQQLEFLRWHKCDAIQGYYISKPVPAESVLDLFTAPQRRLG